MESQFEELAHSPDIIIATPGRLMHHLSEVDDMSLRTVEYVVFDEADSLFGMGFAEQLHKILVQLSENRQTLPFSATLPSALAEFAKAGLREPLLDNVINWDFPPKPKIFVHRVGRAARAGRTGTAFSFVTSEDMPYLLDLHIFLSKPIRAAPNEEEVLQDMDGVMSKIDQAVANGETIYGRFPRLLSILFQIELGKQLILLPS